jgi:hypothetical protein
VQLANLGTFRAVSLALPPVPRGGTQRPISLPPTVGADLPAKLRPMVNAPANTGTANNNRTEVIKMDHGNNFIFSLDNTGMFNIVVMKFNAPKKDETPATCNDNTK